jgi:hypothetical protein
MIGEQKDQAGEIAVFPVIDHCLAIELELCTPKIENGPLVAKM